jgi:hypothetical protein
MIIWILVILLPSSGLTGIEFYSLDSCREARAAIILASSTFKEHEMICVAKGAKP